MAMMKKHTRPIVVDGTAYRYRILALASSGCCGRCDRAMGLEQASHLKLEIELGSTPGQRLDIHLDAEDPRSGRPRAVTPANVARYIRGALARGWDPHARAPKLFQLVPG